MRHLARCLIAAERLGSDSTDGHAAFRVCEKLRRSLSALAGAVGFRTLQMRALALAKVEVPWLSKLEVDAGGSLLMPDTLEKEVGKSKVAAGGEALVAHSLELLATFIGEPLTRRLVQQIWPETALDAPTSEGKT